MIKELFIFIIGFLSICYVIYSSNYYSMCQLSHLQDRIRFGRLQYHKKANLTLGNIHIHNKQKILNITFKNQQIFIGESQHFLVLMKSQAKIKQDINNIWEIQDEFQLVCKIQRVDSLYTYEENMTIMITGHFQDCQHSDYYILLTQENQDQLKIYVEAPKQYQRIYTLFNYRTSDHYYGLGQQFSYLDLGHNRAYSTFLRQKGIGRGSQPLTLLSNLRNDGGGSYFTSLAPSPIWFSSRFNGYIMNSFAYFAWINNKIIIWDNKYQLTFIKTSSYKKIVKQISQINGYTKRIPQWINQGAIVGLSGTIDQINSKFYLLKLSGAKIAAVFISDTHDRAKLQINNTKVIVQTSPIISDRISVYGNNYKTAQINNYFVKLNLGVNYKIPSQQNIKKSLIDFKNTDGLKYYKQILQVQLSKTGASGILSNLGTQYPIEQGTIQKNISYHNKFSTIYHKKINQILQQLQVNQTGFYVFAKSGYLQSPSEINSLSTGDHTMDFDFNNGLPSCLTAILSSGLVGYANTHCDIGGNLLVKGKLFSTSQRTQMLLIRWMQLSSFTSIFKTSEGQFYQQVLQVNSNQFLIYSFSFYSHLYSILRSYRSRETTNSFQQKLPLIRALFLQLQGQQGSASIQDQFYLGDQIMVAPYMDQKTERRFYLPKGEWKAIWDGKVYKGCSCQRIWKDNMLPPAFIRSSSLFAQTILKDVARLLQQYKQFIFVVPNSKSSQL